MPDIMMDLLGSMLPAPEYATKEYVQARIAEAMNTAGSGPSVVLESATFTANGTYQPNPGKAWDDVTVNVSAPAVTDGLLDFAFANNSGSVVVENNRITNFNIANGKKNYFPFKRGISVANGDTVKVELLNPSISGTAYAYLSAYCTGFSTNYFDINTNFAITTSSSDFAFTVIPTEDFIWWGAYFGSRTNNIVNLNATLRVSVNGVIVF